MLLLTLKDATLLVIWKKLVDVMPPGQRWCSHPEVTGGNSVKIKYCNYLNSLIKDIFIN